MFLLFCWLFGAVVVCVSSFLLVNPVAGKNLVYYDLVWIRKTAAVITMSAVGQKK